MNRNKIGSLGVAIMLAIAFTLCVGLREARAAAAFNTVVCEGTITGSSSASFPNGHFVSISTSKVAALKADCLTTNATVTQVIDASCGSSNPCVINGTTTAAIPLAANPSTAACAVTLPDGIPLGPGGVLISGPIPGCQSAATIAPFNKLTASFLMQASPFFGSACPVAGATATANCTAFSR